MKKILTILLFILISIQGIAQDSKYYRMPYGRVMIERIQQPEQYKMYLFNDSEYMVVLNMGDFEETFSMVDLMRAEMATLPYGTPREFEFKNGNVTFVRLIEFVAPYAIGNPDHTFEKIEDDEHNYIITFKDLNRFRRILVRIQKKKYEKTSR